MGSMPSLSLTPTNHDRLQSVVDQIEAIPIVVSFFDDQEMSSLVGSLTTGFALDTNSVETEDGEQCSVDSPLLFSCEVAG